MNRIFMIMTLLSTPLAAQQNPDGVETAAVGQGAQNAAPGTTPLENGPATVGELGAVGGTLSEPPLPASAGVEATGSAEPGTRAVQLEQSAVPLIEVPDVADAGLAESRLEAAADVPETTLEGAVLEALSNNPTPRQARAIFEAAAARAGIAASAGKPQGNVSGGLDYSRTFGASSRTTQVPDGNGGFTTVSAGGNSSDFTQQLALNLSVPLYTGGRVRNSRKAAQANARAALANARQTEQEVAVQTILGYLNVLQAQELLEVAESNLATARERRRIAGVRFDAGVAARLEVLRADSDLAAALQNRVSVANSVAQAKAALNILLARSPETPLRVQPITTLALPVGLGFPLAEQATAIAAGSVPPPSAQLRAEASDELPSLEAARENINASTFNVEAQRAQRKPSLGASLTGLLRNPVEFVGRFILSAGLSVAQTLFDGGRISSQVREARAQLDQARLGLDGQQLQVANAIEGSLLTLDAATKRLAPADTAVLAAREALRAAQLAFTAGLGTPLQVLEAQNALVAAQRDAVNARYEVAQAQTQLAAATAVVPGGSATGRAGLGASAGTGQNATISPSGAAPTGTNIGGLSGAAISPVGSSAGGNSGFGTGSNTGGFGR